MTVRFFNFAAESQDYMAAVRQAIDDTISSGQFILGPKLQAFETAFAEYIGVNHCLGVSNGLDAIRLILKALQIDEHAEVIVPAHTFIASWLPVSDLGAKIIPVEPDDKDYNINPAALEQAITERTKAIMVVHLYGAPANMSAIRAVADRHQLPVIEDAAQAQGAKCEGAMAGSMGLAGAFSFYPTKNLGALGDAGAITTNDQALYSRLLKLRNYGSVVKYQHDMPGLNCRLDEIQAAVLLEKLTYLESKNQQRNQIAGQFLQNIKNPLLRLPQQVSGHVWHQFVVRVTDRQAFMIHLQNQGVESMIHYPVPPHLSGAYQKEYGDSHLPLTEQICQQVVSLPIYPGLSEQEIQQVIAACNSFQEPL